MPKTQPRIQRASDEKINSFSEPKWSHSSTIVRRLIKWIKARGGKVSAEDIVAWDDQNGRRLFDWDEKRAAQQYRLAQARVFLNSFRSVIDGMRVRAFINVPETEETERAYYTVEYISQTPALRMRVIADISRRMKTMAGELKWWKLSLEEREAIIRPIMQAMEWE